MLQVPIGDVEIAPGHVFEWSVVSARMRAADPSPPNETTTYNQAKHFAVAHETQGDDDAVCAYVAGTFEIAGPVDRAALEAALLYFVRRHEVLRCTFQQLSGDLSCDALTPEDIELKCIDAGSAGSAEEVRAYLHRFFQRVDTLSWPLITMGAVVRDDSTTVYFACDHLVTDGLSTPIAVNDIATAYEAYARGEEPDLPEVGSYLEFSRAQRDATGAMDADDERLDHWKEFIARGDCFFPPFPLDLGVEPGRLYPTVNVTETLLQDREADELAARCEAAGGRLFMGVLAAVGVALRKEGGPDVYRGLMPVNERGRSAYAHTMGWFINTMPIEFSVAEDRDFPDVMSGVRDAFTEMQRHADVPFVKAWHLLAPGDYTALRYWPYAVNFFSYLDFRKSPGARQHVARNAKKHLWVSRSNGICFWFHRNDAGLHMNAIHVDTPQARHAKAALGTTLTHTLANMRTAGTF
ncbi:MULTISPECIES: condensation domain-containing protein [Streptomyces]|uniref:Condensation domain-containing protein n=1 Tax=Streptomyces olivaceiscleroticus TaxID=68245 RepID=A0ABP3JR54_9ACTN|nr:condensation domain-containing protein [Streptomyces niger]